MAYQVLYRKYRPASFDEVVGQEYIVKTLKNAIAKNQISHAYLFSGPRGTGKTSLAKLFAKTINCTGENKPCGECDNCKEALNNTHPDIIELDAASNNSIDNIRDIISKVKYPPLFGKYKVYIIDEVHMLSTSAFNALLKTLEEPPANVIFILATTEPQKIIPTVLSRCQRYNFSKIPADKMKKRVIEILEKENIPYEESAVDEIINLSDGGMRDVLSILEQVLSYGNYELHEEDVLHIYGLLRTSDKVEVLKNLKQNNINSVITTIRKMYHEGVDITRLTQDIIRIFKDAIIYEDTHNESLLSLINKSDAEDINTLYTHDEKINDIDNMIKTMESYRNAKDVLSYFEISLLKMVNYVPSVNSVPVIENKPIKSAPQAEKPAVKESKVEVPAVTKDEEVKKEEVFDIKETIETEITETKDNFKTIDTDPLFLLSIVLEANKDEKLQDIAIYHNLSEYGNNPDTRKYFNLLKGTEIMASSKDAIIFVARNDMQMEDINDLENNKELYYFLKKEYQIDKMIYGINETIKDQLFNMYRNKSSYNITKCHITRYDEVNTEETFESKLKGIFGDIRIEE